MIGENELHIFFTKEARYICKFLEYPQLVRMNYIYFLQKKPDIYVNSWNIHNQ